MEAWTGSGSTMESPGYSSDADNDVRSSVCSIAGCPPCVVQIRVDLDNGCQQGTGILLDDGRVLTAAHVVRTGFQPAPGSLHILFGGRDGHPVFDAASNRLIVLSYTGPDADLAVLSGIQPPNWAHGAQIAKAAPKEGDVLTSVGLEQTDAVRAHCGKMVGHDQNRPILHIGVQAQLGDSGGPVFNARGELVGINSAIGGFTKIDSQTIAGPGGTTYVWSSRYVPCTFVVDLLQMRDWLAR
jgi:hypothetical protein